jgi:hypothetical protein
MTSTVDMEFDADLARCVALRLEALRKTGEPVTDEMVKQSIIEGSADFRAKKESEDNVKIAVEAEKAFEDSAEREWLEAIFYLQAGQCERLSIETLRKVICAGVVPFKPFEEFKELLRPE